MRAGPLQHRITIQALPNDAGTDAYGAPLANWADLYSLVPANIQPMSGREIIAAQQTASTADTRIGMRYLPNITSKTRIIHPATCCGNPADTIYDVLFVEDVDMDHRQLTLLCGSGLTQG